MARGSALGYKKCDNADCVRPAVIRIPFQYEIGVCNKHYQRYLAKGDWSIPDKKVFTICSSVGCGRPVRSTHSDKCETHYYRVRRGSVLGDSPIASECTVCGVAVEKKGSKICGSKKCKTIHQRKKYDKIEIRLKNWNSSYKVRAKRLGSPYEDVDLMALCVEQKWTCGICGNKIDKELRWPNPSSLSIDHENPLAAGGGHTKANCRCSHLVCNLSKATSLDSKVISKVRAVGKKEMEHASAMLLKYQDAEIKKRADRAEIKRKKRERATEKRALEQYARRIDLQKLIIRGSDLLPSGDSDDGRSGDNLDSDRPDNGFGSGSAKKARPKTRWGSRPFAKGSAKRGGPDRNSPAECNEGDQAPDKD